MRRCTADAAWRWAARWPTTTAPGKTVRRGSPAAARRAGSGKRGGTPDVGGAKAGPEPGLVAGQALANGGAPRRKGWSDGQMAVDNGSVLRLRGRYWTTYSTSLCGISLWRTSMSRWRINGLCSSMNWCFDEAAVNANVLTSDFALIESNAGMLLWTSRCADSCVPPSVCGPACEDSSTL